MNDLKETVDLMLSPDYKERFKAEYYQVKIRHDKLIALIRKWDNNELDFVPTCSKNLLLIQSQYMEMYMETLEIRAEKEGVEL